jgi:uncharacterized protein YukE
MALLASLRVDLLGDMADLSKKLDAASAKLEKFGKKAEQIGKTMSKTLTAPIVAFGGASVRAFGIQEDAERKLAAAIRATGGEVDKNLDRFKSFASEMQRLTVVGDETTLRLLQVATAQGLTADSAERATKNAISMQSAFGVSAESAIRMTAALEQGDATMLRRYIPALRGVEDEVEMLAKAHEILAGSFGIAEEEARTTTGQIKQLKNSFGDLMEEVGGVIASAIQPLIARLQGAVKSFQSLDDATKRNIVAYAGLVAAIGPALVIMGKLVGVLIALTTPLMAKIALVASLAVGINYLVVNAQAMSERFVYYFDVAKNAVLGAVQAMLNSLAKLVAYFDVGLGASLMVASAGLDSFRSELADPEGFTQFGSLMDSIRERIGQLHLAFTGMLGDLGMAGSVVSGVTEVLEDYTARVEGATFANRNFAMSLEAVNVVAQKIPESFTRAEQAMSVLQPIADQFVNSFGQGMANVVVQGEKLTDVLKNIGKLLASAVIQKGIALLLTGGIPGASGFLGAGGGLLGSLFGRAKGGRVTGGSPYMVGERGPELFVPGSTGGIISNGGLAGSGSVNVTGMFRISGSDLVAVVDNSRRTYR